MLKIVGVPTEDESIKLYNDWKKERDDWNKEAKKHNNILVLVVVAIYLVVIAGALTCSFFIPTDIPMNFFRVSFASVSAVACFCVVAINWYWQLEYCESERPMPYRYYAATNGKEVLDASVNNGSLNLVLENDKHEVNTMCIEGFSQKVRTDVNEIIVDITNSEILFPYNTNNN